MVDCSELQCNQQIVVGGLPWVLMQSVDCGGLQCNLWIVVRSFSWFGEA